MEIPIKEWLWPNIPTFITTLGVVTMMYLLFRRYLFKPMRQFLNKRSDFIAKELKESQQNKIKSEKLLDEAQKDFEDKIVKSQEYAQKFIDDAKNESAQLVSDTKKELKVWREDQEKKLEQDTDKARQKLYEEVAKLSIEASKKILDKELNEKTYEKLVDDFIKKETKYD